MSDSRPRPVFDPSVPTRERALLAADPERLVAASLPAPQAPRVGAATIVARAFWIPAFAFFYGVLPGGWFRVFFLASLDDDTLLDGVFRWGRTALLAMMALPAVQILLILLGQGEAAAVLAAASFTGWTIGAIRHLREPAAASAARDYHGRYLLPADFDRPAAQLLLRAQRAIDAVLGSESHRAGLLDDVDNTVVLPRQEWEIAWALAEHTKLRRERRAQRPERLTPRVLALLEPQRRAMDLSVRAITDRIEALETYARRARDADDAYHEWQVVERLPEQNARYRDLLARTVGHDLARDEIERLAGDAQRAETMLRDSVGTALQAGRALAVS
ncbi:hypothetical protein [Actinomadura rudentiformis]|uniref:Uncharacterized protein n=1 Tax=Actinomadura rudentiformis TaxID=359158 RepID=A0A6H9YQY9_9ACTN|nr:hypothetical protein [Actinomadura rudentiformis]KAB2342634.1 hypothetical protein F8566_36940 [Actinomadura rudentiformis]